VVIYLTLAEAAQRLGIGESDVRDLLRSGRLLGTWMPTRSAYFVKDADVAAYLEIHGGN
jgi:excisionase family DNA binding protein